MKKISSRFWILSALSLTLVIAIVTTAALRNEPSSIPAVSADAQSNEPLQIGLPPQTDVHRAKHTVDENGVPFLTIENVGTVHNPSTTAFYALAYAGVEEGTSEGLSIDKQKFNTTINWLVDNLKENKQKLWIWNYEFDNTYNDIEIKAPWYSAFGQAVGIQALLASWRQTNNTTHLKKAEQAAQAFFVPISKGGLLFSSGNDVYFEEIPHSDKNPSHILNGHMRALLAIKELHEATKKPLYKTWFDKGLETLLRWLPRYDTGYWLRYDLNPKKKGLLFRLANPYAFSNPTVAIDKITLRDPISGKESVLDIGAAGDHEGTERIAGNDWGQIETVAGRNVRRLLAVMGGKEDFGSTGQMVPPYSYFYLDLPDEWNNNLRSEPYEITIDYYDEKSGNLTVQMRSISPGAATFRDLRNGDLLLSGSGQWRSWKVALYPNDLGYWVGEIYGEKHVEYLEKLLEYDKRLKRWASKAKAYANEIEDGENYTIVEPGEFILPKQTPPGGIITDQNGIAQQFFYNSELGKETPHYSPFGVALQLLAPSSGMDRMPAFEWLKNPENQIKIGNDKSAVVWIYSFTNTYNDVETFAPWASAFSQAYIVKALNYCYANIEKSPAMWNLLISAVNAYRVSVKDGGIKSETISGTPWFEEIPKPNATHILNGHLVSIAELTEISKALGNKGDVASISQSGASSLRDMFYLFDTGYWMRYDLNPKKQLLLQLDWLEGGESPLIGEIQFQAPQFRKKTVLDMSNNSRSESVHLTGREWSGQQTIDGRTVVGFENGYNRNKIARKGGTRHNVYIRVNLPVWHFEDYFDVQPHRLHIKYKDVAPGRYALKIQVIHEGSRLDFVPLRDGVLKTIGDGRWKTAVFTIRPQDMGWSKGAEYQVFEIQQLTRIAAIFDDWFFKQCVEREQYFLDAKLKDHPVIIE